MNVQELLLKLNEIAKIPNEEWLLNLEDRKVKELEFHNQNRELGRMEKLDEDTYEKFYSNKKFYSTVKKSTDYHQQWIKINSPGKVFLDYACGNGGNAMIAAKAGAALAIGIDISDVSIQNCILEAKESKLENTFFLQADAENTKLPDNSVDVIICSGMLHHLDLNFAFPELQRILAPGGKILAVEALDYNPFIKLYRKRTPNMRTDWEKAHILSLKDVKKAKQYFNVGKVKYWHLTSYLGAYIRWMLPIFNAMDFVFTRIPLLKLWSWIFTFELISKKK